MPTWIGILSDSQVVFIHCFIIVIVVLLSVAPAITFSIVWTPWVTADISVNKFVFLSYKWLFQTQRKPSIVQHNSYQE